MAAGDKDTDHFDRRSKLISFRTWCTILAHCFKDYLFTFTLQLLWDLLKIPHK